MPTFSEAVQERLLTSEEVAELFGISPKDVLYARRKGLIKGFKKGWVWLFDKNALPKDWPITPRSK